MVLTEPCELWAGAMEKTGYGRRKVAGKMWMAHRYAYFLEHGDIPEGMVIDHLCFNRACVEVSHLRVLSREENSARHWPGCTCPPCSPERRRLTECSRGHDVSEAWQRRKPHGGNLVGKCLQCDRRRDREYSRRRKARKRAVA